MDEHLNTIESTELIFMIQTVHLEKFISFVTKYIAMYVRYSIHISMFVILGNE